VYLVPVSPDRYEMYYETEHDESAIAAPEVATSWWRRQVDKFRAMLAEAERERRLRERGIESGKSGLWRAIMRKVADVVAEQRLLWHLRAQTAGRLLHPDDLDSATPVALARAELARDLKKHRLWTVIDALLVVITGPLLFFVPGPNIVAYYFLFRAIGHYFAMRGARQGLDAVEWRTEAAPPLSAIRAALKLPRADRLARLDEIAQALGLNDLAAFVERVAPRTS